MRKNEIDFESLQVLSIQNGNTADLNDARKQNLAEKKHLKKGETIFIPGFEQALNTTDQLLGVTRNTFSILGRSDKG